MGCGWFAACMCFFAKKKIKIGMEITFDYNWIWERGQIQTVCLCKSENCDGYIDKKKDVENDLE